MYLPDREARAQRQRQAPFGHSLNIDFLAPELGPSGRVAVELSQESARALAKAIEAVLESAPPGLE